MNKGGFDVVIGNPPYVEYSKVRKEYEIRRFATEQCGNLYAFCIEKALGLTVGRGRFCFIVPLSVQDYQSNGTAPRTPPRHCPWILDEQFRCVSLQAL